MSPFSATPTKYPAPIPGRRGQTALAIAVVAMAALAGGGEARAQMTAGAHPRQPFPAHIPGRSGSRSASS